MPEKDKETNVNLSDIEINPGLVVKKIENLRKDSAPGPDSTGIHPPSNEGSKKRNCSPA
jgi:hypothetical protein